MINYLLLLPFLLLNCNMTDTTANLNNPEAQLIYIGDPMCSWCYGIAEELRATKDHFADQVKFEMVMGGLRPYNTQTMADLKDFLSHHWSDVNKASGQKFNYGILDSTQITYDTEPPCRASVVVRDMNQELEFDFFKAMQKTFYFDNKNMHLADSYFKILDNLKLNKEEFIERFNSDEYKMLVRKDFEKSSEMGVRSFPTVILKKNGQSTVIAQGFATKEEMIKNINAALN